MSSKEELVMVPVPRHLYGRVIAYLATLMEANEGPGVPEAAAATSAWTQGEIERLKRTINATGRAVMDLGSKRPGELVSFTEVQAEAGLSADSARGGLSGLTRHVKKYYKHENWPFDNVWGTAVGRDEQMYYRVSKEVSVWWRTS